MGGYGLRSLHLHPALVQVPWRLCLTTCSGGNGGGNGDYYTALPPPRKKKHGDVLEPSILSALSEMLATSVLLLLLVLVLVPLRTCTHQQGQGGEGSLASKEMQLGRDMILYRCG